MNLLINENKLQITGDVISLNALKPLPHLVGQAYVFADLRSSSSLTPWNRYVGLPEIKLSLDLTFEPAPKEKTYVASLLGHHLYADVTTKEAEYLNYVIKHFNSKVANGK
jgi:hypothetical protein